MATPPTPPSPDPLQPVLQDVEAELSRRLHEACEAEARGVSTESADEIRRLEDSLLAAAVAAQQALTLRRHMRERADEGRTASSEGAQPPEGGAEGGPTHRTPPAAAGGEPQQRQQQQGEAADEAPAAVREFRDSAGRAWRAWPVTPGLARPGRSTERYLGELHQGWICFEALDSSARRRLPCSRSRWAEVRDEELEPLLQQAISAPERKGRQGAAAAPEPLQGEHAGHDVPPPA